MIGDDAPPASGMIPRLFLSYLPSFFPFFSVVKYSCFVYCLEGWK